MSLLAYTLTSVLLAWLVARRGRISRAAAITLVLLPLCLTGRAMLTGAIYGPIDLAYATEPLATVADEAGVTHVANPGISDNYAEFIPWNDALRRTIAEGEWPLWNRFELNGGPLAGALQSAPYHPVTLIGLLIPIEDAVTFTAAMTFFLAALAMFLLLRDLVRSEIAAMFGAAAVMFSTHLIWYAGTALALAAALAPLALVGARRVVHAPGKRSAAVLGIALLLIVLAGHPESALHLVTLAIAYFVFEFIRMRPVRWRAAIGSGLGAGLGALLVSAIFLLPFMSDVRQTAEHRHRELTFEGRQPVAGASEVAHRIAANLVPFLEGVPGVEETEHPREVRHGWLATAYAGSLLFAPALFALLRVRSWQTTFFGVSALVGLGVGVSAPGFTNLLNHVPGFQFAVNDRMIFGAVLGTAVLAAIGIDAWLRERSRFLPALYAATCALLVVIAVAAETDLAATYYRAHAARAILPLLLGAGVLAVMRAPRAAIALFALLLVQRLGEAGGLQPTVPRRAFYPPFPGVELMQHREPFRMVGVGVTLPPATSTHYGLEDVRAFQALTLGRYYDAMRLWSVEQPVWFNRVDTLESPFLSAMNVRFAIAPASHAAPAWWTTKGDFGEYKILENTRVLPRAFVPRRVFHREKDANLELEMKLTSDYGDVSFIETGTARSAPVPNGPGTIAVQQSGSGLRISASMQDAGWVVISNGAWEGWQARVDGNEAPVLFANRAFLAVFLQRGQHVVELFYRPVEFVIGAWISALSLLAIALVYSGIPSSVITFFMSLQTSRFADGFRSR
jgi:Bacterial membrane protein YfhO